MWMRWFCLMAPLLSGGCSDSCVNTALSSTSSPDGAHQAVRFQRDCGATTGLSTQISILAAGDQPSRAANAFIADDDHGAADVAVGEGPWAEAVWLGPDTLVIRYDAASRVFRREGDVEGVNIRYEPVAR